MYSKEHGTVSERALEAVLKIVRKFPTVPKSWYLHKWQAPIMALTRPAIWGQTLRGLRTNWSSATWNIKDPKGPVDVDKIIKRLKKVDQITEQVSEQEQKEIKNADFHWRFESKSGNVTNVQIYFFTTRKQWLDVVEMRITPETNGTAHAMVTSFSSGFIPAATPLAPLFNILFFWFNFQDWVRIQSLRSHIDVCMYHIHLQ
ncbi:hypothetical protein AAMO2058_000909800 [Amorphochlora amoebiformis]